jgi:O-antigen/teichoic acid export membrane protein
LKTSPDPERKWWNMQRRLFALPIVVVMIFLLWHPAASKAESLRVFFAGSQENAVYKALKLTSLVEIVNDPMGADVIVLDGKVTRRESITAAVKNGKGLVLFLEKETSAEDVSALFETPIRLMSQAEAASLAIEDRSGETIVKSIVWKSSPQVRERFSINGMNLVPLVKSYESGEMLLGRGSLGKGNVYVFTPFLEGANPQIQEWAYFNYFIYSVASDAAGRQPLSFGDYPASPVPHTRERLALYGLMALLLASSGMVFFFVRRYSLAHPELLNTLVANRREFELREAGTAWEKIGFHRPIGGFLFAVMTGLFLFIPLIIYQNLVLPVYILPSAQAMGIWGRVAAFFPIIWSLFDMGTSVAHIKYFAEHRVRDPQRAIQYAQFFVWWQAISGAVQVALVVAIAGTILPNTVYAMYIWAVIAHTMIQIPGFFMIMSDNLTALQRSDYNQIVDMAANLLIPMVTQPIMITLLVLWGKAHPAFGAAMGGVIGLGVAAYTTQAVSFLFGLWLYRRIGYNAKLLFMAHFDLSIARESLKYGSYLVVSGLIGGLGSSLQVLVIQNHLINNNEVMGNLGMAGNFVFAYSVLLTLTGTAMPAISEAFSNRRKVLSQYYVAMTYKYGGFISAFLASVLLAVADRFIIGSSGKEFERAALYAFPLILQGALQFASWTSDIVMFAANKTRLVTIFAVIGLVINFGVAYLLVDGMQVYAIIVTGYIGLIVKDILAYLVNNRYCFKQKFYAWQTLVAPLFAGTVNYVWLRWLTGVIWKGDEITSMLIFLIALLPSYPVYSFFYGLFGGWDDATLAEFALGAELSSFMRPLTRLFHRSSALGARISPLHNRFPIRIRAEAMLEAESLTNERVSLIDGTAPGTVQLQP